MNIGYGRFDKGNGVMINFPIEDFSSDYLVHTISPPRKYIENELIGEPFEYTRFTIDFVLSKEIEGTRDKDYEFDISILVLITLEDFEHNPHELDLPQRWGEINNIKLANYDTKNKKWINLDSSSEFNVARVVFTEPITLNGTEYFGYITADIIVPGDPPIAVGR